MQAVGVIPKARELKIIDHPKPEMRSGRDVRIRSLDVGICGTDREICTFVYGAPPEGSDYLVLGHESLGEVVEVGDEVTGLKPGDLVVPSVRRPCADTQCRPCREDLQDFCVTGNYVERGIKSLHGYMTEEYVEQAKYLNPVPANLRDVAVLVEPLTIAEKGMAQVWQLQSRLPWTQKTGPRRGSGLNAVVLGAGPVGILGTMKLIEEGFRTFVYSRSPKPNFKASLVEAIGATYLSSETVTPEQLAGQVGNIDLVYEAIGVSSLSFRVMKELGTNGVYVFTGIPAPHPAIAVEADQIMRNLVLKNQVVVGTVNADPGAFHSAINDLQSFHMRWSETLKSVITKRYRISEYRDLLQGPSKGIKNVIAFD